MPWTQHDIPGGDWKPRDHNSRGRYADRMHQIRMPGMTAPPSHPNVSERHLAEEIDIGDKVGWPSPMDRTQHLAEGYLPLLELVIEGLESYMPQDESERRHDLYALAVATHRRVEGRIFFPDGWYRYWAWMPHAHESMDAYREALLALIVEHRI